MYFRIQTIISFCQVVSVSFKERIVHRVLYGYVHHVLYGYVHRVLYACSDFLTLSILCFVSLASYICVLVKVPYLWNICLFDSKSLI